MPDNNEKRPLRLIPVRNCKNCPYRNYDNGGGYTEPFHICKRYNIILIDENKWSNLEKIHKDCKLPKYVEGGDVV